MSAPRLRDVIEVHARQAPDAVALVAPGRPAISYAQLRDHLTATGRRLRNLGVNRRDRVALVIPDGPEALTAFLAVSDQTIAAPVNPKFRQTEYEAYFTTVGVTALITALPADSPADAAARSLGLPVIRLVISEAQPAGTFTLDGPQRAPSSDGDEETDVALILTTSGTTSRPKVVPLTHANLCNSAANIAASLELTASDRCFGIMPLFHVHGLVGCALASFTAGGSVICPPGFDAPRFFSILDELKPTWYTSAPTLHQAIVARVDRHRDVVDRSRLRVIRSCSAALPSVTREALEAAFRAPVVEAYGMTEAAHQMTSTPLPVDRTKAGSVGVSTGTAVAILDATGEPLAAGQVGEIAVRGKSVTAGYESAPAANAQAFVNGWFRTGDEGRLDEDGFLFITGRLKEIINRGGEKISPPEVDQELLAHPAVAQAFAFSMPDPRLGEAVAAVVVLKPGAACTERELREFAASRLATFKVPDRVVFVDEIPKTATGKVQRIGMADRLGLSGAVAAPPPKASPAAPAKAPANTLSFVHRIVAAIWCDVLGLDEVGPDQPFFDLGGDSILAAQVLGRVREMLHVDVSVIAFFDEPTVAGLVGNIARATPTAAPTASTPASVRHERAPLSSAQQRLWFLDQWAPGNPAYHDYAAWRVTGPFDADTLERSLNALLQRHDVLRTSFPQTDGRPEQVIAPTCTITIDRRDISTMPAVAREPEALRLVADHIKHPFDLTKAPLVRCLVVRVSGPSDPMDRAVHVVVIALHHLVCDGWSMAVLQRELAAFYSAFRDDRSPELARLPIQYADHAIAEIAWMQSPSLADQLGYWQKQLATAPLLDLPTDRPRPPVQGTSSGHRSRVLSGELCERLRTTARTEGATMFMLFVAAFNVVLARNARQEDVVIGTPIAGRRKVETEALIGPFANTLALRTDVSGDPAFRELLARVRRVALEANAHQDLPFEKIVETLGGERRVDRAPLFQVFFNYRNLPPRTTPFPGLDVEPFPIDVPAAIADLSLEIVDRGAAASAGGLQCRFDCDADLFDAETMDHLFDQFGHLLEGVATDPGRRLSELTMMSPAMRDQILVSWNDTATPFEPRCIHQLVEDQVERTPDQVAVRCGDAQISYRDLNTRANRLARVLAASGATAGTRVGISLAPAIETIVAILAVLKTGAAYVPLDPLQPRERLRFVHKDADLVALVTERRLMGTVPRGAEPVVCVDDEQGPVNPDAGGNLELVCSPEQLFCIIFTSGSTGVPKGVMLAHRAVCNRLFWAREALPLEHADRVLLASSIAYDSSIIEIFEPLIVGAVLVIAPSGMLDPRAIVQLTQAAGVTVIALVPALLEALVADPGFRACRSLRRVTIGGEALTAALARSTLSKLDLALSNGYGPTEACVDVIWWHLTRADLATMDERPVPIGRPIANARAYVLDSNGQPVPVGMPGELYLGGECLSNGYWRRPDLTDAVFVPDPFTASAGSRLYRTGDLVRYRSHGVIDFLGRVDDQIKIRGIRIEPQEVVAALRQHPAIRDAAVVADRSRTRLLAYLVADAPAPGEAELRQHLRDRVPDAMIPSVFVVVDALPRTVSGKIDRRALPEVEAARAAARAAFAPAETPTETALVDIWQGVLQIESIGIDDDFFALGGHSLLAAQVIARVHVRLDVTLPIRQLFETPTVRRLGAAIETTPSKSSRALQPADRTQPSPLSFAQRRLWFLDQLEEHSSTYHVDVAWQLDGPIDVDALRASLTALVERHEALRTIFPSADGVPVQVITPAAPVPLATEESRQPFDLARGPLFRAALIRQTGARHALVLTMHHIVCDGWSIDILCRELSEIYIARIEGRTARLTPIGLQYVDYAAGQQRWLASKAAERQLAYWTARLSGAPPSLDLPTDRPRPPVRTTSGARVATRITPEVTQSLTALSRRHGVTLYMTLLAAFSVLLSRHTSQSDIVVGSPTAGRPHTDLEPVVGFFVNTLVHRINLTGDPSVTELLRHVRDGALDAYANGDLPFDALVESLHTARDPSRTPIFQIMFALQHGADPVLTLPGVRATPFDARAGTAKCDLLLIMRAEAEGLRADFEYNTDLFDEATMQRLCARFVVLLESFAADDHRHVSALLLLPDNERRLLAKWNETDEAYPRASTIHELFAAEAGRRADDVVVVQGDRRLTCGEIDEQADELARRLRELGVGADVPVGVCTGRSPEMIVTLLAILKAGGAYLPLNPSDPIERLSFILRDAGARVVFAAPSLGEAIAQHVPGVTTLAPSEGRPQVVDDQVVRDDRAPASAGMARAADSDSLACIMYTSGSTGEPKGVAVPHRAIVRLVYGLDRVTGTPPRRFLQLSPLSFDASTFDIWVPLLRGGQCVLFDDEPPTIDGIERAIRRDDINCLWLTSALFNAIVDERPAALEGARDIFVGGEALSPPHIERALKALPAVRLVNGYGPTEATTFTCCHPIDRASEPARPIPIGRPLANTRVFILDAARQASPIGVTGEIYIGGDGLAREYVNRPDVTAQKFVRAGLPEQVMYRTGDLGRFRPDGAIEFIGRTDRQIKLRGFRIELEEIEAQLERHPDVRQVAVTVQSEPGGEKSIVAFVALRRASTAPADEIRAFLSTRVPAYMVPSTFVVLDALPLTDSGKIDRAALPGATPSARAAGGRAPQTETHRRLAVIWAEVLGDEPAGVDENFFEAGGHSLLAMRVMARIENAFGVTLPVSALFHAPTIAELARTIEASHPIGRRVLVPIQPGGNHPPLVLVHSLGGEVWNYVALARRLAPDQPCFGLQLPDFGEGETFPAIEALASRYVDALIRDVPGPYTLAGYSSGATIAFEMAHQLQERGRRVLLVVALDAGLPNRGSPEGRLIRAAGMVGNIPWWIRYDLLETPPAQMADRLRRKVSHAAHVLAHRVRRAGSPGDSRGFDLRDERGLKVPWGSHRSTHYAAVMAYHPRKYAGRVLLLRARARPLFWAPERDLGWSRMVSGPVTVSWIPGSHETILREPYVREVARHIRLGIDTARKS